MNPAQKHKRIILIGFALTGFAVAVLAAVSCLPLLIEVRRSAQWSSALEFTQEWARLARFPAGLKDLQVQVRGTSFTREFRVEFRAPRAAINAWLSRSPGTRNVNPVVRPDGSLLYSIRPGGGAQFAELLVSDDGTHVRIRTYWS